MVSRLCLSACLEIFDKSQLVFKLYSKYNLKVTRPLPSSDYSCATLPSSGSVTSAHGSVSEPAQRILSSTYYDLPLLSRYNSAT